MYRQEKGKFEFESEITKRNIKMLLTLQLKYFLVIIYMYVRVTLIYD